MSLYDLTPKQGHERYTVQIGWNPHRTFFATVMDFDWDPDTDPDNEPDSVHLGLYEATLDPAIAVAAVAPYAHIPDDLLQWLRADRAAHPLHPWLAEKETP